MTEDEAKTKGCCGPNPAGVYRDELSPWTRYCVGSACMAWRWHNQKFYCDSGAFTHAIRTEYGHCGLAGKP